MSLARGAKGGARFKVIRAHRQLKLSEYLNRLIDGDPRVTPRMVTERAKKLKELK